jgi:hypothetical protein
MLRNGGYPAFMFVSQQFVVHLGRPIDPSGSGGAIRGIGWEVVNIVFKNQ